MRTMLCLASLAALLPTTDSDACGPMPPRVLALSTHGSDHGTRTFARLETAVPAQVAWQSLWRMSYDNTQIAPAPRLATPIHLTLVGNAGTREVTTGTQIFLRESWGHTTPTAALDVGAAEGFQIAVEDTHEGLAWTGIEYKASDTPPSREWLDAQRIAENTFSIARLAGKQVVMVNDGDTTRTILRDGDRMTQAPGTALGILTADGMHYLVTGTKSGLLLRPIWGM